VFFFFFLPGKAFIFLGCSVVLELNHRVGGAAGGAARLRR